MQFYDLVKNVWYKIPIGMPRDPNHPQPYKWKNVKVSGIDGKSVALTMDQGEQSDRIIFWDIKNKVESDSFAVSASAEVIFDSQGMTYVCDEDFVILGNPGGARSKAFQFDINDFPKKYLFHGIDKGYRVNPVD